MTERELRQRIAKLTIKRDRIDRLLALTKGKLQRKRAARLRAERDYLYRTDDRFTGFGPAHRRPLRG